MNPCRAVIFRPECCNAVWDEAYRMDYLETGGALMGLWQGGGEVAQVLEVVGPGPRALHRATAFEPDYQFQKGEIARIYREHAGNIDYLGDWHTHPAVSCGLSKIDRSTLRRVALCKRARCPRPLMVIIDGFGLDNFVRGWQGYIRRHCGVCRLGVNEVSVTL